MLTGSVLFVCAANRCRSPLAMALLQNLVAEQHNGATWRIESAGLHAFPNFPATPNTQKVAREVGLDLSQHCSRSIDQVRLEDFDLILTLEQIQAEALASAFPHLANVIRPFSVIVNLHVDIEDPTGLGVREHRALRSLLSRYLQAGLPRLSEMLAASHL